MEGCVWFLYCNIVMCVLMYRGKVMCVLSILATISLRRRESCLLYFKCIIAFLCVLLFVHALMASVGAHNQRFALYSKK